MTDGPTYGQLVNIDTGEKTEVVLLTEGEDTVFRMPRGWAGQRFRLVVIDDGATPQEWDSKDSKDSKRPGRV